MRKGDPRAVSGVISLVLAFLITLAGVGIFDFFKKDKVNDKPAETTEQPTETDEGSSETSVVSDKLFSDAESRHVGSEVSGQCAVVCDFRKMTIIADKGKNMVIDCGDSSVFAVLMLVSEKLKDGIITENETVVCPASASGKYGYSVSSAIFPVGKKMTVKDILLCMMYQGGSGFGYSLAVHISGSEEKFVSEMNAMVKRLGMEDTHYTNVCGESDGISLTTVYDISVLMKYFFEDAFLMELFTSKDSVKVKNSELSSSVYLSVENDFFTNCCSEGQAKSDGIIGGKTGECGNSGWCFVLFRAGYNDYFVAVMNSRTPYSDALNAYTCAF